VKSLGLVLSYLSAPSRARNIKVVLWLLAAMVVLVVVFSVIFHVIMAREGQDHSWMTGVYWTLTVMSTLGFGDITFESDLGRFFSVVVLVSGALFILVLLPFAFIQFVFVPWVAHRDAARAPRSLPATTSGHIVLTDHGTIEDAVIRRARFSGVPYVLLVPELERALALHDEGYRVMVGALDDPATYRSARVEEASMVAATNADTTNANIAFTVREIDELVPIVATATTQPSVDILELAGCNTVLQLGEMLGIAVAQRVLGTDARSHIIGAFDDLLIAEAAVAGTALVGRTLREADLRSRFGIEAVGTWDRGVFALADPDATVTPSTVLILAGSAAQLGAYDAAMGIETNFDAPAIIVGGGRVGRAAGRTLAEAGIDYRIIERQEARIRDPAHYVLGDAADLAVLEEAGIERAAAILVTTHDDDINVYLTIYLRKLRPDVQIISRANLDRNVSTLHRAGADAVLSYASTGAAAIWNTIDHHDTLVLAEGLDVFRVHTPASLVGRTIAESHIRGATGATVVALIRDGRTDTDLDIDEPLPADADLIVIGSSDSVRRFHERHPTPAPGPG
jgi:Trk K+ transport system NAD-binding subunit